jgi:small subunit ribosomal protein S9
MTQDQNNNPGGAPRQATAAPFAGLSTDPGVGAAAAPMVRPLRKPAEMKGGWIWGTGRRKTAVARVRLRPAQGGDGKVRVQIDKDKYKTVEEYFAEERDRNDCYAPLKVTNTLGKVDVVVRLNGGGFMGQAGAVLLGVSRALRGYDPTLETTLRDNGMLTRDSRDVERKKYGQAGARRRFQLSKR